MSTAVAPTNTIKTVFYGFGAWVGRLDNRTTAGWWADDPNNLAFDATQLIKTDLSQNPSAYLAGKIKFDEIIVDNPPDGGGLTKIGPTWPIGSTINSVWLESQHYHAMKRKPPFPPPYMNCNDYELTTVAYWTLGAKDIARRFWGYHAQITNEQGSLALVSIWTPGTSRTRQPVGSWWIDLATDADPIHNGFTTIGVGAAPKTGALFLNAIAARGLALFGPKMPPGTGGQSTPLPK